MPSFFGYLRRRPNSPHAWLSSCEAFLVGSAIWTIWGEMSQLGGLKRGFASMGSVAKRRCTI
jgi:hypothetical protein